MHRLVGACVSRQLPDDEARHQTNQQQLQQQQQSQKQKPAKSSKGGRSYGFGAFKSPWRRQQQQQQQQHLSQSERSHRPLSSDADRLAASNASAGTPTTAGAACKSAPPLPERRPVAIVADCSSSGSRASDDLSTQSGLLLPVRSVTVDNFRFTSEAECDNDSQPDSASALLRPSLRSRLLDNPAPAVDNPPASRTSAAAAMAESEEQQRQERQSSDRPDTVTSYSEVCASTDNETSQASTVPAEQPQSAVAATVSSRRSRLASGASSLDSDDLMLGTDCDVEDPDANDEDAYGGLNSLTASRAGGDLAECLIKEEEEYDEDEPTDEASIAPAGAADIVGSLMTASLPPDSLARHLRRQQQPPLSLSLAANSLRFRPRSVSSPQGDLLLLPGSDLRHLAHDVTGVKTLLLRLRRQLLDDGRASVVATPTGCCSGGGSGGGAGSAICQLCGSDAQRVAELESRVADLQAEVDLLRRCRLPEVEEA